MSEGMTRRCALAGAACLAAAVVLEPERTAAVTRDPQPSSGIVLPDAAIAEAYEKAAAQNVLAAVDDSVFPGYFSVCADRDGFGRGFSYPSLDGHQLTDALLMLGRAETARRNFAYVRGFQKPDGRLPLAILPGVKEVSGQAVDPNGGLYTHWVPGNPLRALAGPTYIQNADVIYRATLDHAWLKAQIASVNLAADYLASLVTPEGLVAGAGYYVEFPTRIEFDGVAQCHAADAFRRVSSLNRLLGDSGSTKRYATLAARVTATFRKRYWVGDHFGEYIHPQKGLIDKHGLTDTNWAAIACGLANARQAAALWPKLRDEAGLAYGGMPTGIAARPDTYEEWEFALPGHRHDLAAMGRVWYLECWARARMGDADGIVRTLQRVCRAGKANGYYWRERYHPPEGAGAGPNTYCEYPANLIRIVNRFLLGIDLGLDGSATIAPTVPKEYRQQGFGTTVLREGFRLTYRMDDDLLEGAYTARLPVLLKVRCWNGTTRSTQLRASDEPARVTVRIG
ncbi:MAG: hypothetical protein NT029_01870 [Armatimonadetes bacterium]|nr:hypothetical protein [Armatimonadota bacterium]